MHRGSAGRSSVGTRGSRGPRARRELAAIRHGLAETWARPSRRSSESGARAGRDWRERGTKAQRDRSEPRASLARPSRGRGEAAARPRTDNEARSPAAPPRASPPDASTLALTRWKERVAYADRFATCSTSARLPPLTDAASESLKPHAGTRATHCRPRRSRLARGLPTLPRGQYRAPSTSAGGAPVTAQTVSSGGRAGCLL